MERLAAAAAAGRAAVTIRRCEEIAALGSTSTDLVSLQLQPHIVLGSPEAAASLLGWHTLSESVPAAVRHYVGSMGLL
jgi:hypothetical protein